MKFEYEKREAIRIKVELSENIDEYAKSFLAIYNNVKNDRELLKVYNDYGRNVYIVCENNIKDAAERFLEQFGKIVSVTTVEVVQPIVGLDFKLNDEYDTEFLEVEDF